MATPSARTTLRDIRRWLVVLPVLLGVLVMHGLTSNHDMGMATALHPSHHMVGASGEPGSGAAGPDQGMAATTASPPVTVLDPATRHAGHDMGPACLGALTLSGLALALARARRRRVTSRLAPRTRAAAGPRRAPPALARPAPSLTRLCISRT